MKVLIAYFSWTGMTEKVADRIAKNLSKQEVEVRRMMPSKQRGYLAWLTLSLFPGSRVKIQQLDCDLSGFDLVMMGSPKWTLSCPPFNEFLGRLRNQLGKKVVYFMTYGGFDQERFARRAVSRLNALGCQVVDVLLVKRRLVETGEYAGVVDQFCARILDGTIA